MSSSSGSSHAGTPPTPDEIDALALRAQAGDRDAMEDLLGVIRPRALSVCRGVLPYGPDAEDACQEALLSIATKLSSFSGRSRFTTWAHVIALNAARSTYRRMRTQAVSTDDAQLERRQDPRTTSVIAGTRLDLLEAVATVERDHPQLVEPLLLRDVYGLTYAEIAAHTQSPVGTVKSRVHDARQLVRPLLRPQDPQEQHPQKQDPQENDRG
ncbi:RNA polymerase sigma factor [Nocardioides pacificus]